MHQLLKLVYQKQTGEIEISLFLQVSLQNNFLSS